MATLTYYFQNALAGSTPDTKRGAWDDASATGSAGLGAKSGVADSHVDACGSTDADWDVLVYRFVSAGLPAATDFTGTVDGVIGCVENNLAANLHLHLHVYVTQGDTDTPRGTLWTDYIDADEASNSSTTGGEGFSGTMTDLSASAGDRIVVEAGGRFSSSDITYTCRIRFGSEDATNLTNDGNSATYPGWIRFSYTGAAKVNLGAMRTVFIPSQIGG